MQFPNYVKLKKKKKPEKKRKRKKEEENLISAPVSSTRLTLNSKTGVVTVHENDAVDVVIECRASGRPTPTLVLVGSPTHVANLIERL